MQVETVTGPILLEDIGITLTHEHILNDLHCLWEKPEKPSFKKIAREKIKMKNLGFLRLNPFLSYDNCTLDDINLACKEINSFKQFGGRTIVESTSLGIGRDPTGLKRISNQTGVNIIMGTGYYLEESMSNDFGDLSIENIKDKILKDLLEGSEKNIKAGIIGEIGTSHPITKNEEKSLRAAAQAQKITNTPLYIHLDGWSRNGHKILDIIKKEGGIIEKVVLCHMNPSFKDKKYQHELASRGAFLGFDMIGMEFQYELNEHCPTPLEIAKAIVELIDNGYIKNLLLSQDVFLKMMLKKYGGHGYSYILENFIPILKSQGLSLENIETLLCENPKLMFKKE